jgi:hypothetical protein
MEADTAYVYIGNNLRKHINTKLNEWEKYTTLPRKNKMTTNLIKVGLYRFDKEKNKWIFTESPEIFASGFENKNLTKLIKEPLLQDIRLKTLENIYSADASEYKEDNIGSENLKRSFNARGIASPYMKTNKFDGVQYSHSEQAFLSEVDQICILLRKKGESGYEIIPEVLPKKDDISILIIASTNEICKNCFLTLNNVLDTSSNFYFFQKLFAYFAKFIPENSEEIIGLVDVTNDGSVALPKESIIFSSFFYDEKGNKKNHNLLYINPIN